MATARPKRKTGAASSDPATSSGRKPARPKATTTTNGPRTSTKHPKIQAHDQSAATRKQPDETVDRPASAPLVADVRSSLGVTRELFARLTGFSVRAISGWEAGRPLSEAALRQVKEMQRLCDALAEGMRPEFLAQWLETPCEGLGGLKPVEVLERGETDRLWRVVLMIGSGMPT